MGTGVQDDAGVVGGRVAERIERHGLKPEHVGLLTALAQGTFASQQDLAGRLGVAPAGWSRSPTISSSLRAVRRVRDPHDRRRQVLTLTDRGRELLSACACEVRALDEELTADVDGSQREVLHTALGQARGLGGPADGPCGHTTWWSGDLVVTRRVVHTPTSPSMRSRSRSACPL
ncbi:MarR family winged helix-turn-helix transcriptional regulator [Streptomyces spiralis]